MHLLEARHCLPWRLTGLPRQALATATTALEQVQEQELGRMMEAALPAQVCELMVVEGLQPLAK